MNTDKKIDILCSNTGNTTIGNLIHTADKMFLRAYTRSLKDLDLTLTQALILLHIYNYKQKLIYQKDLEEILNLTNPTVTNIIKNMIKKDLLYKVQSEEDGRYFHLHLTPRSVNLLNKIPDCMFSVNNSYLSKLSAEEQVTFIQLLMKIIAE